MNQDRLKCVCFGAGALGLGFLGPELSPVCHLTYVDVPVKGELLNRLHEDGRYAFNRTGLAVRPVEVSGVDGLPIYGDMPDEVADLVSGADLVFTAVGEPNLPKLAPIVAAGLTRRPPGRPLGILCGENGVEIARNFRNELASALGREPGPDIRVGDTVMGRMCKVVQGPSRPLRPPAEGFDWAVVAEPFFGIPVEEHAVAHLASLPAAIEPQGPARFRASEDTKMLAHNGLHAVLACVGHLRGARYFDELRGDGELMEQARRLLVEEAGTALLRKHGPALPRNEYFNYCDSILRRVTCPVFRDSIQRGVRGIIRKLQPWERLVYSLRTVAEQGGTPTAYAAGLAAAVTVARQSGETELSFADVLADVCAFDPEADAELIDLVEERRDALTDE